VVVCRHLVLAVLLPRLILADATAERRAKAGRFFGQCHGGDEEHGKVTLHDSFEQGTAEKLKLWCSPANEMPFFGDVRRGHQSVGGFVRGHHGWLSQRELRPRQHHGSENGEALKRGSHRLVR